MSSRLFKHQMAMSYKAPIMPHMVTTRGDVYGYNSKTNEFKKLYMLPIDGTLRPKDIEYSPNGKYLVACVQSNDSTKSMQLLKKTATGYTRIALGVGPLTPEAVTWSPDSKYIFFATYSNGGGCYWYRLNADDTVTLMPSLPALVNYAHDVAVSEDGKIVAVSSDISPYLTLYRKEGEVMTKLSTPPPNAYSNHITFIGNTLLFITNNDYGAYLYDVNLDSNVVTKTNAVGITTFYCSGIAVSPDKAYVVNKNILGTDYYRYNATTKAFTKLSTLAGQNNSIAFSKDGKYLAAAMYAAPWLKVYSRVGDTLVEMTTIPAPTIAENLEGVEFDPIVN